MLLNRTRWVSKKNERGSEELTDLDLLTDRLLASRGVESKDREAFLNPRLEDLAPPDQMSGLTPAVHRLKQAVAEGEEIVIYGDYDVDGMTSISILVRAFRVLDYPVRYYIPDRHEEGYGLNADAIRKLINEGARVIITVDCGITSTVEANICREAGVDLIITDHHEPHAVLPDAFAVLNPKKAGCPYPYKHLAGAGIALRVSEALLGEKFEIVKKELIELSAFGTVADVAPLLGENRIIVHHGLSTMSETIQTGLKALIDATEMTGKKITAGHIGFVLGPKLNAAGRIADAMLGVRLLTTEDPEEATVIARQLVDMNEQRQAIEKAIVEAATLQVEQKRDPARPERPLPPFLVVSGDGWHGGVIGIVASRIVERYHRPVIVFGIEDGMAKGSGRSIEGFNLFEALQHVEDLFLKFGGHEQAAGMTLKASQLHELEARLCAFAAERLTEEDFKPLYRVEATLGKEAIRFELTKLLRQLEPYGVGNPKPLFRINDLLTEKVMTIGRVRTYLKVVASDGLRNFDLINFQNSEIFEPLKTKMRFDALVAVEENDFRGVRSIQFDTKDIRVHEPALHFDEHDLEVFHRLKAEAIIHEAYQFQQVSSNIKTDLSERSKDGPEVFAAYSLQGWLMYYHRFADKADVSADESQFYLCPVPRRSNVILLDPPGHDLRKEAAALVPNRDRLKSVYLKIRSGEVFNRPMPVETLLSLRILESAGLIQRVDELQYKICPVASKIDLTASPLYAALHLWTTHQT